MAAPTYDGREYLLPPTAEPAWLLGGAFRVDWHVTSGPDRGQRYHDRARFTVAPDSVQALGGGYFTFPYQVRLEPLGPHGRRTPPIRTWLVQRVTPRVRGDSAPPRGLTILDAVRRTLDGGGTVLTLTQLDTNRFAAVWQSDYLFARRTWYGRRVLERSEGYICAVRIAAERDPLR